MRQKILAAPLGGVKKHLNVIILGLNILSHENKKALSPFYHENIFDMGVLHSFSIKNIFYNKMELRFFYFHVTIRRLTNSRPMLLFYRNHSADFQGKSIE